MGIKMYVECCKSKDKGNLYHVLKADLGYTVLMVTMEKDVICQLCDIKFSDLFRLKEGDKIPVALNVSK